MKKVKRRIILLAVVLTAVSTFSACYEFNNPTDSGGTAYPGYPTVASISEMLIISPESGGSLTDSLVSTTPVSGATTYEIRIASSESGLESANIYSRSDYTDSTQLDISLAPLANATAYWWQVRCSEDNGVSWGDWSAAASFTTDFSGRTAAAAPTLSPDGGIYTATQSVTISSATSGAVIYYTLDGSDPKTSVTRLSGSSPVGPISVSVSTATTIRATAFASGGIVSSEKNANYRDYTIGDTGPAGGFVFYDKGSYSDDWRWMEVAPVSTEVQRTWGDLVGISNNRAIGYGLSNTEAIVNTTGSFPAAEYCYALEYGGCDDWFLPSRDEMLAVYDNLHDALGLGDFKTGYYWMSKGDNADYAWYTLFSDGSQGSLLKDGLLYLRAARYF